VSVPPFYRDREDLAKAQRFLDDGHPVRAWAVLREILIRHPWRPKRVRRKLPSENRVGPPETPAMVTRLRKKRRA